MNTATLAEQQPQNIDEALECMRTGLEYFHARNDRRAIFLRLYYIMTLEVHAAVNQLGDYQGKAIFLDPDWIAHLSGHFCTLYFRSLDTFEREPDETVERAWKIAHRTAAQRSSTVVQNALLGINAHINYDLAHAIALNMDKHGDLGNPSALPIRKFDHDQVNNLLVRSMPYIQDVLAHDYGPGIATLDRALGQLDERFSRTELKYYRERVWADALAFAAAIHTDCEQTVREKLNWESYRLARVLTGSALWERAIWLPEHLLGLPRRILGWEVDYAGIRLEAEGGVAVTAATSPFG